MIDIVIPTYGRADRIAQVAANIEAMTNVDHRTIFVIEADDQDSVKALAAIPFAAYIVNDRARSYSGAINCAYHSGDLVSDWIFAGADDLKFHGGWDHQVLFAGEQNPWAQVIGTNDLINPYVQQGWHATHYLVRKSYLDEVGGIVDEGPGSFLHEGYGHNFTDTEFIGTAKARCVFRPCLTSIVEHLHQSVGGTPRDATHEKAEATYGADEVLYDQRKALWWNLSR